MSDTIGIEECVQILQSRGLSLDLDWIRKKAREGKIPGAVKVGGTRGVWLFPREWAETYVKSKRGRPVKE